MEIRAGFDLHFRLCENRGFAPSSRREQLPTGQLHLMGWSFCLQPAINSFADCPLKPLECRTASIESKKMIVNCLIKRVDVYRDYKLHIDFNIDFEQFSMGLDIVWIAA